MKVLKNIFFSMILCGLAQELKAQYNQYAQFQQSPLLTNSALIASEDESKAFFQYRRESLGSGYFYNNPMLSLMMPLQNSEGKRWGGVGLGIVQDVTETNSQTAIATFGLSAHYAHNLQISDNHLIALGLQASYFNKNVKSTNLLSAEEILTGSTNDPLLTMNQSKNLVTFGLSGLWYQENKERKERGIKNYFGISASHLNRPNYNFSDVGAKQNMPVNWVITGGWQVYENEDFAIQPNFRWIQMQKSSQVNVGALGRYFVNPEHTLGVGLWWSTRAIVGGVQYQYKSLMVGISYDLSTQDQVRGNSPELLLGYKKQLSFSKK